MSIEMLDGYFAALICGPEMVLPSEYLPQIWGEDFSFDNDAEATEIMGLTLADFSASGQVIVFTHHHHLAKWHATMSIMTP